MYDGDRLILLIENVHIWLETVSLWQVTFGRRLTWSGRVHSAQCTVHPSRSPAQAYPLISAVHRAQCAVHPPIQWHCIVIITKYMNILTLKLTYYFSWLRLSSNFFFMGQYLYGDNSWYPHRSLRSSCMRKKWSIERRHWLSGCLQVNLTKGWLHLKFSIFVSWVIDFPIIV